MPHHVLTKRKLLAAGLALGCRPAAAQGFPNRPLRIVVPYTPGASTDNVSRAFAEQFGKAMDQSVIVENKPGAGTAIGTQYAKGLPADGYTLLFGSATMISAMLGLKRPGYTMEDFVPVALLGLQHYVMITPSALPTRTVAEFVAYAKANPAKMNYAMLGPGAPSHTLADRLRRAAGFTWQDVAFRGGTPALQAVMSNDAQAYFGTLTLASEFKGSDKVRLLAICSDKRSAFLPDVPTFAEAGVDGMEEQGWYALFARAGTPAPILEKLRATSAGVMRSPAMQAQLRNNQLDPSEQGIDAFAAGIAADVKRQGEEMARLGLMAQ